MMTNLQRINGYIDKDGVTSALMPLVNPKCERCSKCYYQTCYCKEFKDTMAWLESEVEE